MRQINIFSFDFSKKLTTNCESSKAVIDLQPIDRVKKRRRRREGKTQGVGQPPDTW